MERYAGRYGLLKQLGSGGMGEVFLAVDLNTGAEYALKRLKLQEAGPSADMIRSEFEALARIRHPSIVRVVELGLDFEGAPFLVMEYIPGWSADRVVRPGEWPLLAHVAARVVGGLEALHTAGVAHGDLKPSNILVVPPDATGRPRDVRLVDFGLAALAGRGAEGHRGTPGYTAPEIVTGSAPDPAADLYALGATLYSLATGRGPFEGADLSSLLRRQQAGPPSALALEEAGAPEGWVRLILHLLSTQPVERPRNATEVRRVIEQLAPAARVPLSARIQGDTLVGRNRELARIERSWRRAARGACSLVLAGESGIGKSALLDAFSMRAALAGRSVVRVSAAASPGPAGTWSAVARRLAAEARVDLAASPPELRAVLGDGAAAPDDAALAAVSARMAEWCRAIAERAGAVCVLVDDADALDPASFRALRRSMLAGESAPAMWLLARRSDVAASEEERLLVDAGALELMALSPLAREDVARLAASRIGSEPVADLVEFLWQRAAGHPGLTVENLRAAAAAGAVREEDLGIHADRAALERVPQLPDFEATRLARLATLPRAAQSAARVLAACAQPIEFRRIRQIDASVVESALEALRAQGLAARDGEDRWSLTPPAIGARLLEEVSAEDLRAIHAAILGAGELSAHGIFTHRRGAGDDAGALEAAKLAFDQAPDPGLATEASGLAVMADPASAALWLERASRAWMDRGRYATAAPLLVRALELDAESAARPERWGMLSTCRLRTGDLDGVARDAAAAKREKLTDGARALVLTNEAARLISLGSIDEALALSREASSLAEKAESWVALGNARLTEAMTLVHLTRLEEASAAAARAEAGFSRGGNRVGALRCDCTRATILWQQGRVAESEALFRSKRAESIAGQLRLPMEELSTGLSSVLIALGRWPEARAVQSDALRICLEDARPLNAAIGMANLALLDSLMGNLPQARIEARRGKRLCREHSPGSTPLIYRAWAAVMRISGNLPAARTWAERALFESRLSGSAEQQDWCLLELARVEFRSNRWKTVSDLVEACLARRPRQGSVIDVALAALAGGAAVRLGRVDAAAAHNARIEAWPPPSPGSYAGALADQLRAEIAIGHAGPGRGVDIADRVLAAFATLPATPDRAVAALEFARLAIARRSAGAEAIERWLDQAVAGFERLGDHRGREQALAIGLRWFREFRGEAAEPGRERNLIEVVSRLLDSMSDFSELTQRAMQLVVEQLDAERGVILLADPDSGRLEARAEHGTLDATTRRDAATYSRRVVDRVAESGGSLLISDAPADPKTRSESVLQLRLRSILCVPMFRGGRVIGAVYLDDSRRRDAFSEADRSLLEGFAQLMAIAIESSRGQDEVRRTNRELVGENLSLRQEVETRFHPSTIIGRSAAMLRVLALVERAAMVPATVLLTGENGTGKERLARVLHHSGKRKLGPFVAVNCGAIPEQLLESELFGILPKVATEVGGREGRFVQANGGTLFLDEIGEMPLKHQVALLSVLSNREVTPVGGGKPISVDVRVIAATNQDLLRRIGEGSFREDLFYRLNVIPIEVPPLRDRKADIPALARHFVEHFAKLQERDVPEMSPEFLAALMQSDWPGNVRELQNYIERIMAMTSGRMLLPTPLPRDLEERSAGTISSRQRRLADQVAEFERRAINQSMERAGGNQSMAARELGMTEQTLRYRLKKHGLASTRKLLRSRKNRR